MIVEIVMIVSGAADHLKVFSKTSNVPIERVDYSCRV